MEDGIVSAAEGNFLKGGVYFCIFAYDPCTQHQQGVGRQPKPSLWPDPRQHLQFPAYG